MRIIDRYVLKEVASTWTAVTLVLLAVTISAFMGAELSEAAKGRIPASLVFSQMGLKSVEATAQLLPLSLFLGILLAFGRLYRDSEMVVMSTAGLGLRGLVRPLSLLLIPGSLLVLLFSMVLAPWADFKAKTMLDAASDVMSISALHEGRFQRLPGGAGQIYAESIDYKNGELENVFIHNKSDGRESILTARRGFQSYDAVNDVSVLVLLDGRRVEGIPGKASLRRLKFERIELRLPKPQLTVSTSSMDATPTHVLWSRGRPNDGIQLQWRLAQFLSAWVLMLLAIPLSQSSPREGRYSKLVLGLLVYAVYTNVLIIARVWLREETIPAVFGLWWVHGLFLLAAIQWIRHSDSGFKRRAAA